MNKAIILGGSSAIGTELIERLSSKYSSILSTYNSRVPTNMPENVLLKHLDIATTNLKEFADTLQDDDEGWDLFVSCIGTQEPVGLFESVNVEQWVQGFNKNFTLQIELLLRLLPFRNRDGNATVVFFAGGGTNGATPYYSAYTLGKIGLIKCVELLDDEISDTKFVALGPGWMLSDIHNATIEAGPTIAGQNYFKTRYMLDNQSLMNTSNKVVDDIFFLISQPKHLVGGRNFSSVHDSFSEQTLQELYDANPNFYRLKRFMN